MAKIHEAIIAVMGEIGAIGKDSQNKQQNYNYRSVEQVYNRVQPLFVKHGIFTYPKVVDQARETGKSRQGGVLHYAVLTVEYTFAAEDGSSIAVTVVGEGMDSGDKASNKAMAAAHKYAICQSLNIPYEVIDPDAFTPEPANDHSDRVTEQRLTALKKAWTGKYTNLLGLSEGDKEKSKKHFSEWVQQTLGDNFNLGGKLDVTQFSEWSGDDMKRCEAAVTDASD